MDAGIGLRSPHVSEILRGAGRAAWLEVHAENYMGARPLQTLARIRETHPVSVHGVGLSLGAAPPLDREHLGRLRALVHAVEPLFVSEHLAFNGIDGIYTNALLPIPYDDEAFATVSQKVSEVQESLGRPILVENPSRYLSLGESGMTEAEFLSALVDRTGCGLLCDVNNLYVSSVNLGFDPAAYLRALPAHAVGEIHLAGHTERTLAHGSILLDDHASAIAEPGMLLYADAVRRFGPVATLIEWDAAIPDLATLLAEARRADELAAGVHAGNA